jgi:putative oxidoreductase
VAVSGQGLARLGFQPPEVWGNFLMGFELVGGACIVLGLLTRFFAAGLAIEMAIITFAIQFPLGSARGEPYLVWGIALLAIALRGGGPYSVDSAIGKEL